MAGVFEQELESIVIERITTDPRWASIVAETMGKIKGGFWDGNYIARIFQNSWHKPFDMYDAYCFAEIHTAINSGRIAHACIEVHEAPLSDKNEVGNNEILSCLPEPFFCNFRGGPGDNDGHLGWYADIEMAVSMFSQGGHESTEWRAVSARWLPLEVGFTRGATTLGHLGCERGLARWPYNSTSVWLYVVVDDDYLFPKLPVPEGLEELAKKPRQLRFEIE